MTTFDVNAILSSTAYGSDGDKIGKVEQVFLDDNSGEPTFLTVNTGLFGAKENFVPVKGARQDGDRVVLPYTKDVIKDAPKVDADQHLSPAEEEELYRYYELNYNDDRTAGTDRDRTTAAAGTAGVAGTAAADRGVADRDVADRDVADRDRDAVDQDRRDVAATAGDEASVVRHEERLNVGTQEREAGHARLRKYVVTDHETVDVPVEREEVTVERTPINDTNTRVDNGTIGEEEVDVTLHEERPVVQKEAVAVEEVGLNKQTVQETQRVEADVRKEQVDVETDVDRGDLGRDGEAPRR
ncbi:PRC and DUF2382 domain-containing protein [Kocuria marina]|uniref:PRC and DUF2382 domain-containing protein n=1 Tax=Kocuria marina TaxID=223184 RepID=UPI002989C016|nr:PRC and DUF2382 domain-containing protein [Kocuria marina]MCT1724088.1 PRC and DUF2382 domain-containing protein [Kocuria marina]MCT1735886.1 PRC and DUF2382 domain-containing protein [Kocuria marina]